MARFLIMYRVFIIRCIKVMLDRDLAELYSVEKNVERNIERFPEDFMFELKKEDNKSLRSQNVTLKRGQHSNINLQVDGD